VQLQPGVHYLEAPWPIDTLITMYLTDTSPEAWSLTEEEVHLEVRGAARVLPVLAPRRR